MNVKFPDNNKNKSSIISGPSGAIGDTKRKRMAIPLLQCCICVLCPVTFIPGLCDWDWLRLEDSGPAVICSERPELGCSDYIVLMYARDTTTTTTGTE